MLEELATGRLRGDLELIADEDNAVAMAAYLRDQFCFLGIKSPDRRDVSKSFINLGRDADPAQIWQAAELLWEEPEREFHYVACDLLRRWAPRFQPVHLATAKRLLTTHSWWDTVDPLAINTVGTMVVQHPELVEAMDEWIEHENLWLVRTALIHQLKRKDTIDAERLFRYAEHQASHADFFVRKAIGWALRQHGRTDPDAVRSFVDQHRDELSGLTKREALKHL